MTGRLLGLALVLSGCVSQRPMVTHKVTIAPKNGSFGPELPIQDCEDVDVRRQNGQTVRIRIRDWHTEDQSRRCSTGIGVLRPFDEDAFIEKLLRRTGLCPDCRMHHGSRLYLHEAVLYIRGFGGFSFPGMDHISNPDEAYPLARYAQLKVGAARFTVIRNDRLVNAELRYECPHNDPDYYDIACLRFIAHPTDD